MGGWECWGFESRKIVNLDMLKAESLCLLLNVTEKNDKSHVEPCKKVKYITAAKHAFFARDYAQEVWRNSGVHQNL